ncbi:hypothetical protein NFI96_005701 [Prochilodus magdalenae]|nr:hypothetical protein NFI96_005701 [Prochilodus magdalenae]
MFAKESGVDVKMWYKQRLEHAPLEVGTQLEGKSGMISNKFDRSRYKISITASGVSLRIEGVTKEDEGMYFCGAAGTKTLDFSNSTFLAVTGQLDISVLQTPVQGPVPPGQSVTLQCTVLSDLRAADLRVLWFRAAAGQSFPEIIYTHQNSSSRQCEISSSTHCSVYNISRTILNRHHTGTYYCAVAACEKIIFGNGTAVEAPVDPVAMTLAVFSAVCVAVICAQTIFIYKMRRSEHRAGGPVHAEDLSKGSFVSVESGKNVTLHCRFGEKSAKSNWVWYRQRTGQEPEEAAVKLFNKIPTTSSNRLKINDSFNLTIEQTNKDDEGMYFCGEGDGITITFSKGTFLAVTDQPQLSISVLQTPVPGSVSPGESVTLQCTVLSEIRAADLRVLWFRAAAGQSFPEIIYTHQNSSSRQCEISSSTHSSVYNFSRNILNHHHTGTYYCAVAACGKVIVGNGAPVYLASPMEAMVFYLAAALGICVIVICVQAVRNSSVREHDSVVEKKTRQDSAAVELNYAARSLRKKSGRSGDSVYSEVRYFTVTDPNNH